MRWLAARGLPLSRPSQHVQDELFGRAKPGRHRDAWEVKWIGARIRQAVEARNAALESCALNTPPVRLGEIRTLTVWEGEMSGGLAKSIEEVLSRALNLRVRLGSFD